MPTYSTRPPVPDEVFDWHEDILRLEQIRKMLWKIDPRHICEDAETARQILQVTSSQIRMCERYARHRVAVEFLDPRKKLMNVR